MVASQTPIFFPLLSFRNSAISNFPRFHSSSSELRLRGHLVLSTSIPSSIIKQFVTFSSLIRSMELSRSYIGSSLALSTFSSLDVKSSAFPSESSLALSYKSVSTSLHVNSSELASGLNSLSKYKSSYDKQSLVLSHKSTFSSLNVISSELESGLNSLSNLESSYEKQFSHNSSSFHQNCFKLTASSIHLSNIIESFAYSSLIGSNSCINFESSSSQKSFLSYISSQTVIWAFSSPIEQRWQYQSSSFHLINLSSMISIFSQRKTERTFSTDSSSYSQKFSCQLSFSSISNSLLSISIYSKPSLFVPTTACSSEICLKCVFESIEKTSKSPQSSHISNLSSLFISSFSPILIWACSSKINLKCLFESMQETLISLQSSQILYSSCSEQIIASLHVNAMSLTYNVYSSEKSSLLYTKWYSSKDSSLSIHSDIVQSCLPKMSISCQTSHLAEKSNKQSYFSFQSSSYLHDISSKTSFLQFSNPLYSTTLHSEFSKFLDSSSIQIIGSSSIHSSNLVYFEPFSSLIQSLSYYQIKSKFSSIKSSIKISVLSSSQEISCCHSSYTSLFLSQVVKLSYSEQIISSLHITSTSLVYTEASSDDSTISIQYVLSTKSNIMLSFTYSSVQSKYPAESLSSSSNNSSQTLSLTCSSTILQSMPKLSLQSSHLLQTSNQSYFTWSQSSSHLLFMNSKFSSFPEKSSKLKTSMQFSSSIHSSNIKDFVAFRSLPQSSSIISTFSSINLQRKPSPVKSLSCSMEISFKLTVFSSLSPLLSNSNCLKSCNILKTRNRSSASYPYCMLQILQKTFSQESFSSTCAWSCSSAIEQTCMIQTFQRTSMSLKISQLSDKSIRQSNIPSCSSTFFSHLLQLSHMLQASKQSYFPCSQSSSHLLDISSHSFSLFSNLSTYSLHFKFSGSLKMSSEFEAYSSFTQSQSIKSTFFYKKTSPLFQSSFMSSSSPLFMNSNCSISFNFLLSWYSFSQIYPNSLFQVFQKTSSQTSFYSTQESNLSIHSSMCSCLFQSKFESSIVQSNYSKNSLSLQSLFSDNSSQTLAWGCSSPFGQSLLIQTSTSLQSIYSLNSVDYFMCSSIIQFLQNSSIQSTYLSKSLLRTVQSESQSLFSSFNLLLSISSSSSEYLYSISLKISSSKLTRIGFSSVYQSCLFQSQQITSLSIQPSQFQEKSSQQSYIPCSKHFYSRPLRYNECSSVYSSLSIRCSSMKLIDPSENLTSYLPYYSIISCFLSKQESFYSTPNVGDR